MRTGAEYREAPRDRRRIWILGEGRIDDVTTHPATRPIAEEYVTWYDRHFDPAWQDTLLTPRDGTPVGYLVPRTADDLTRMNGCFTETTFPTAGNIAHTPAYGHMIALGVLHAIGQRNVSATQIESAEAYRATIAHTDAELAAGLDESFSGGGYTALQRSALPHMAWDHVGPALDHRESVYELHANGGLRAWRDRLRRSYNRNQRLANGVLQQLGLPMPKVDLSSVREMARRPVTPLPRMRDRRFS